ncbi:MAG TPA: hypothetical protein VMR37_04635 [Rhabdochlamydiaceae bacterium]|nr:hypothetical protein [Rhabdochlamydiaceae bacterium]
MNPQIEIRYNKFLDPIFKGWILAQPQWKDWVCPSLEEVLDKTEKYKNEWRKYEEKILGGITLATGLKFKRNYIDVFVVSGNLRPFSRPVVLKSTYDLDQFINIITHELIHCLFSDNRISEDKKDPYPENKHILLHAVLKYIYLDILNEPERLKLNIKMSSESKNPEYISAWNEIGKLGYKEILVKIKETS